MKKKYAMTIAILAAFVVVLAAAVALVQYQPSQTGSGNLSVIGTDPPVYSRGVNDASMSYSSVYAHLAGSDMSSGWVRVSGSGSMDLMASQGMAQTLATSQVNAGAYDAFKFSVDSVRVAYQGQAYAATLASTTITAQSQSQVHVNSSSSAAAVVDLRTFIVNTASTTSPQFVFGATAVATSVPPESSSLLSLQIGGAVDLSAQAWWGTFVSQTSTNLNVDASLSNGSLVLHAQNAGAASAQVQEIIVTPVSLTGSLSSSLPASLNGSAVFAVSGSGSVQQSSAIQASTLLSGGATVASGASDTLSYSGSTSSASNVQLRRVVTGQQ